MNEMTSRKNIKYLKHKYKQKKDSIRHRLMDFRKIDIDDEKRILSEMIFCISAANSGAKNAFEAQTRIEQDKKLWNADQKYVAGVLLKSKVRFHNNKARYIINARKHLFFDKNLQIYFNQTKDEIELRDVLAKNVLGLGMKESSHFLRNIGRYDKVAILDRHILKNLKKYDVIEDIPKTLTHKKYKQIENKMNEFSNKIKIPMSYLDLLFWSEQTGHIFK
jgi:N-glycosylase/DNA lyase